MNEVVTITSATTTLPVIIIDDDVPELTESFSLLLSLPDDTNEDTNVQLTVGQTAATITCLDDDCKS